ncbi:MAG TPA: hypothetical protein VMG82_19130 [Candidatus Sulfotelmatobacter sp.]|nr:hypothetical protein [Candidatus Sulfotelmatobacter sp.]
MRISESIFGKMAGLAFVGVALFVLPIHAQTASAEIKIFHRLIAPLRSNPFRVAGSRPCGLGFTTCFLPSGSAYPFVARSAFELEDTIQDPSRVVSLELRTQHSGPFSHHWLQTETSIGPVTLGYGPATIPFIDAGQMSLQDGHGNVERISGMHPIPIIGLPPLNYRYAKAPDSGHAIGKPIHLTLAQADALIQKERKHRFVAPYIPFFHDCRTYACSVLAAAKGKSSLPCYLLFKGYW